MIKIRPIQWQDTIPLRHAVLWPHKSPQFCQVDGDETAAHFGAFIGDELVCVASIFRDGKHARLRKFAAAASHQGKGIGTTMLNHILQQVSDEAIDLFWCDARESAIEFYGRFGLKPEGQRFYKGDVAYIKMSKRM